MTTYYIGADVHSNSTELAIEKRNKIVARYSVPTTIPAISNVLDSLQGKKHMALEEGPMAGWLYSNLCRKVDKLIVADPHRKTDQNGKTTTHSAKQKISGYPPLGRTAGHRSDSSHNVICLSRYTLAVQKEKCIMEILRRRTAKNNQRDGQKGTTKTSPITTALGSQ